MPDLWRIFALKYAERNARSRADIADIDPSVGSVGDSYDNALAQTIHRLFRAEVIKFLGPWKSVLPLDCSGRTHTVIAQCSATLCARGP